MSKVSSYGCVYDQVYRQPDYRIHGIRDKVGWNHTQAGVRNKRTLYRFAKSQEETNAKGCGRDIGDRLSRSSEEVFVMEMERRTKHAKSNKN